MRSWKFPGLVNFGRTYHSLHSLSLSPLTVEPKTLFVGPALVPVGNFRDCASYLYSFLGHLRRHVLLQSRNPAILAVFGVNRRLMGDYLTHDSFHFPNVQEDFPIVPGVHPLVDHPPMCAIRPCLLLNRLPVDIFRLVSRLLHGHDIILLWMTGNRYLRLLMDTYGGVEALDIEFHFRGAIGAPFGFGGYFSKLHTFILKPTSPNIRLSRYIEGTATDLCALPASLTHLSITGSNCFAMMMNREELALRLSSRSYTVPHAQEVLGARLEISGYQRPTPDASRIFYPLYKLFPNLNTLILRSSNGDTDGDEAQWIPTLETRVSQHLNPDGSPMGDEEYIKNTTFRRKRSFGEEDYNDNLDAPEEFPANLSLELAFFQSLPPSLTKLDLNFIWKWSYLSIAQLPPSVTDISLNALHFIRQRPFRIYKNGIQVYGIKRDIDEDEYQDEEEDVIEYIMVNDASIDLVDYDQPASINEDQYCIPLSHLPALPNTIKRLKLDDTHDEVALAVLLERLPRQLESLDFEHVDDLNPRQLKSLPKTLTELKLNPDSTPLADMLLLLPHRLTKIRLRNSSYDATFDSRVDLMQLWPPSMTELEISVPQHRSAAIFNSVSSLPLQYLNISLDQNDIRLAFVQDTSIASLPQTLKTLKIRDAGLTRTAWRMLPPHLTTLSVLMNSLYSEDSRWVHLMQADDLPRSVTKFKCCLSFPAHTLVLPPFYNRGLKKLCLVIFSPHRNYIPPTTRPGSQLSSGPHFHLTDLRLDGRSVVTREFTKQLPRTLTRLKIRNSRQHLLGTALLPQSLQTLSVSCGLFVKDIKHLPRGLTHLKFTYRENINFSNHNRVEKSLKNAALAVSSLPPSLVVLIMKTPDIIFGDEVAHLFPPMLSRLEITSFEVSDELTKQLPRQLLRSDFASFRRNYETYD